MHAWYIWSLRLVEMDACAQTFCRVLKSACARPSLRPNSEPIRPSADNKLPEYIIDCLDLTGMPSGLMTWSAHRIGSDSSMLQLNANPYSAPTSPIVVMYASTVLRFGATEGAKETEPLKLWSFLSSNCSALCWRITCTCDYAN